MHPNGRAYEMPVHPLPPHRYIMHSQYRATHCIHMYRVVLAVHQYTWLHAIRVMGYDTYRTGDYTYFSTVVEDKMILLIFFVAGLRM